MSKKSLFAIVLANIMFLLGTGLTWYAAYTQNFLAAIPLCILTTLCIKLIYMSYGNK